MPFLPKSECHRGHPLEGPDADVRLNRRGGRVCRACLREYQRERRAELLAQIGDQPRAPRGPRRPHNVRRWTDEEIGLVAAPPEGMTMRDIARTLKRSEGSVRSMRTRLKRGWSPTVDPSLTAEEINYIRSTPNLTAQQVAGQLGRKYGLITKARRDLGQEGVDFGPGRLEKSPFHHGRRRVLAKTCPGCGLLLDGRFFADRGTYTTRCGRCRHASENAVNVRQVRDRSWAQRQELVRTLATASMPYMSRHYAEITEWDHSVLSDPDLTSPEKAARLGRTLASVTSAMVRFGYTENRALGNPDDGIWHIQFPGDRSA